MHKYDPKYKISMKLKINKDLPPDDDSYDVINKANNGLKLWENYPKQGQCKFITMEQFCDFDVFPYSDSIRYP